MHSAIFQDLARCHRHLEFIVSTAAEATKPAGCLRLLQADSNVVAGFGHDLWAKLSQAMPPEHKPFADIGAAKSTQADLWVWIAGDDHSAVLDIAIAITKSLHGVAELVAEIDGQQYHQSRDRSGFEDGTGNPPSDEARRAAALIPEGVVGAGGSYVLTQQWQHKLTAFHKLPNTEQEAVIGRTKEKSIELSGDAMPANSHVSRTDVKVGSVAQKVWRRSVPWGGVTTNGLYFVGFACELSRLEVQLERMYGLTDDGISDRLTEFSNAIRSSWWYVPSTEALALAS